MQNFSAGTSTTILASQQCDTYLNSLCSAQRSSIVKHVAMQTNAYRAAFKRQTLAHIKFKRQLNKSVPEDILFEFDS